MSYVCKILKYKDSTCVTVAITRGNLLVVLFCVRVTDCLSLINLTKSTCDEKHFLNALPTYLSIQF